MSLALFSCGKVPQTPVHVDCEYAYAAEEGAFGDSIESARFVIVPKANMRLDRETAGSLASFLDGLPKWESVVPFVGYKEYWIIPDRNLMIGILEDSHGLHVWTPRKTDLGYEKSGKILMSGTAADAERLAQIMRRATRATSPAPSTN